MGRSCGKTVRAIRAWGVTTVLALFGFMLMALLASRRFGVKEG
jgi:hypothetical protein